MLGRAQPFSSSSLYQFAGGRERKGGGFHLSRDPRCSVRLASEALLVSLTDGAVAQDGPFRRQAVALAVQPATCLVPWLEKRAGAGHAEIRKDIAGEEMSLVNSLRLNMN